MSVSGQCAPLIRVEIACLDQGNGQGEGHPTRRVLIMSGDLEATRRHLIEQGRDMSRYLLSPHDGGNGEVF